MCKIFYFLSWLALILILQNIWNFLSLIKRSLIQVFITQKPSVIVQNSLLCISLFLFSSKNIFLEHTVYSKLNRFKGLFGFMLKMAQKIFCLGTMEWNTFSWKNKHFESLKFDYQLSQTIQIIQTWHSLQWFTKSLKSLTCQIKPNVSERPLKAGWATT